MVGYLVLGAALAIGLALILRGMRGASARQAMRWVWQSIAGASILVGAYFLFTGRPAYAVVPALGVLVGLLGLLIDATLSPQKKANTSRVNTRFLKLTLDHRSRQVTGDIVDGPFVNRRIESLRVDELVDLFVYYQREDEPSARLIEAYLDRTSPTWRARYGPDGAPKQDSYSTGPGGPMSKSEALRLLGLSLGATPDEVRAAHRRKLQEHHPDRGGDPDMAARINQARDVLLEG